MECVINFMTEEYQKNLINMVQNRDETFEKALDAYKKLYIIRRRQCHCNCAEKEIDAEQKNLCKDFECMYRDSCKKISNVFYSEVSDEDIEEFFDVIKLCYSDWVNALPIQALERFECLLKDCKMILSDDELENDGTLSASNLDLIVSDIEKRVYYRGRISNEFLGKMDMYHVPYNKRYIINNGRFSLTGQPLLYLGNSVVDVLEELEVDRRDERQIKNFKVSSYEFKEKKRIYDLRCNIWHDLQNVINPTFSRCKVFRNILSIICSFPKKRGLLNNAFTEEYVIPQMLAQILKQNNYDGICYYSTASFSDFIFDKEKNQLENKARNAAYRENLVVFTNFSDNGLEKFQSYDEKLYDSLEVSMPIGLENVMDCTEDVLDLLWKEIKSRYQSLADEVAKQKIKYEKLLKDCTNCNKADCLMMEKCNHLQRLEVDKEKAQGIYKFYQTTFKLLLDKGEKYGMTAYGKIQIQLLVGVFNRLLVQSDSQQYQEKEVNLKNEEIDAVIETCDLYGKKDKMELTSKVHKTGMLHKAFLLILWRKNKKKNIYEFAFKKNKYRWTSVLSGHYDKYGKPDILQLSSQMKKVIGDEFENVCTIDKMIFRDIVLEEHSGLEGRFLKEFEVVEILGCEVKDDINEEELVWFDSNKLIEKYINNYAEFVAKVQQALPLVLWSPILNISCDSA